MDRNSPRTRAVAALFSIFMAPLLQAQAAGDLAQKFPKQTIAYVTWSQLSCDIDLQPLGPAGGGAEGEDTPARARSAQINKSLELASLLGKHPGALALLEFGAADDDQPILRAALICDLGKDAQAAAGEIGKLLSSVLDRQLETERVGPVEFHLVPIPETRVQCYIGAYRDMLLLALGRQSAETMIASLDGAAEGSLADHAQLQFARKKLRVDPATASVEFFVDLPALQKCVRDVYQKTEGDLPPEFEKVITALGINSAKSLYAATRTGEVGAWTHAFVRLEGPRQGLFKLWDEQPLTEADIRTIPKNVYWAQMWNLDLARVWRNALETIEQIDPEATSMVESGAAAGAAFLGFSIPDQLLPAFGDTWLVYDAPSHGGVLLTGAVLVAEVKEPATIQGAISRLVQIVQPIAKLQSIHLTLMDRNVGGHKLSTLVVGGAPVPVAPSWVFENGRWYVGLYPQNVLAAARAAADKSAGSVLDDPAARRAITDLLPKKPLSFGCSDSEFGTRFAYPLLQLYQLCMYSALAGETVPLDPADFPTVDEMLKEARDYIAVGTADDDGLHYAFLGRGGSVATASLVSVAPLALVISVLLPSLARARELAKRTVAASNLRAIGMGMMMYANDNQDLLPRTFEPLLQAGYITPEQLSSPRSQETVAFAILASGEVNKMDPSVVIVYEKVTDGEGTNLLFGDGRVEWMSLDRARAAVLVTCERLNLVPPEEFKLEP